MSRARRYPTRPSRNHAGFSLVELMIVLLMIGVLTMLGHSALSRYIKKSRSAEAVGHLARLWTGGIAYYESDHVSSSGALLPKQFPGSCSVSIEPDCCTGVSGRCPGNSTVYEGEPWRSLGFNIPSQHLYRPVFFACPSAATNMWAEAWGDLDCDGVTSRFIRRATVVGGDIQGYQAPAAVNELE